MAGRISIAHKILWLLNVTFSTLLFLAIVTSYAVLGFMAPFMLLNLFLPVLLGLNLLFLMYWIWKRKKNLLISFVPLLISFFVFDSFYKTPVQAQNLSSDDLSVMSYNTWGFNKNEWIKEPNVGDRIITFLKESDPDILCIQEHSRIKNRELKHYPYNSQTSYYKAKSIQAIFSKYPIVNKGSLDLPDTANNIIFADMVYKEDTVRVYNVHLQSYHIVPSTDNFSDKASEKTLKRIMNTFKHQVEQAQILKEHTELSPYKTIICGDFNNTQFSNIYRMIKGDLKDTFLEKGSGFGRSYGLMGFPMRIDYIFADRSFEVVSHKNYDVELSDHYPIMATLKLKSHE